jgi:xanthine dehydrogenase molybdopterin-binding subunit B
MTHTIPDRDVAPCCLSAHRNTTLLKNVSNPAGFHGSKAVGEPPLLLATSVARLTLATCKKHPLQL